MQRVVSVAGFYPVEQAAHVFNLKGGDPYGVAEYPNASSAPSHDGAPGVMETLEQAISASPIALLSGLPDCGKTFHALLFGIRWQQRPTLFAGGRAAFYTTAPTCSYEGVALQWDPRDTPEIRQTASLWIIDDAHHNFDVVEGICELFTDEGMFDEGHRLLLISWSQPPFMRQRAHVPLTLTAETIGLALRAKNLTPPEGVVLLPSSSTVGLRSVMAYVRAHPDRPVNAGDIEDAWASDRLRPLGEEQITLLRKVALLSLLGLPTPTSLSVHENSRLRDLQAFGLVIAPTEKPDGGWRLADEGQARLIARRLISLSEWDRLLFEFIADSVGFAPTHAVAILRALRRHSAADLSRWLGLEPVTEDGEAPSLLQQLVVARWAELLPLLNSLEWVDGGRFLSIARAHAPADAVRDLARQYVHKWREPAEESAASGEPLEWWRAAAFFELAEDGTGDDALEKGLIEPAFIERLAALRPTIRGGVLKAIERFSPDTAQRLRRSLLPGSPEAATRSLDGLSATAMWNQLRRIAEVDPDLVAGTIPLLPKESLTEAVFAKPRALNSVLVKMPKRSRQVTVDVIRSSLTRSLDAHDVGRWASPHDVIRFVQLLGSHGPSWVSAASLIEQTIQTVVTHASAGAINDLYVAVWKTREPALRAMLMAALDREDPGSSSEVALQRARALAFLDARKGGKRLHAAFREFFDADPLPSWTAFFFLWEGHTFLAPDARALVPPTADSLADRWTPLSPASGFDIAFRGLLGVLTDRYVSLRMPSLADARAGFDGQPVGLACAIAGVVRQSIEEQRSGLWLEYCVESLCVPSERYSSAWSKLHPRERRAALRISGRALRAATPLLADARAKGEELAGVSADFVWDDDIAQRVTAVAWLAGGRELGALARRRITSWHKILSSMRGSQRVWLLWHLAAMTTVESDILPEVRRLFTSATDPRAVTGESESCLDALKVIGRYLSVTFVRSPAEPDRHPPDPLVRLLADLEVGLIPGASAMRRVSRSLPSWEHSLMRQICASPAG